MSDQHIVFIGAGNMASSLIGGLIAKGHEPASIRAVDPDQATRERVSARFRIEVAASGDAVLPGCATAVLAVKPQLMAEVVRASAPALRQARPLLVSVAAGVRADDICRWLGYDAALVRAMPNTPALLGCGATGLFANDHVSETQRQRADAILGAAGITEWVAEESLLDAVTGISGSGPAYYFLLMELMENAAREMGLPADTARRLVLQTALGAARMALESNEAPGTLRERVTSPGGTTEAALGILRDGGIDTLVTAAVQGARDRAAELGDDLGRQ
jgi:pyrroline-5-carboxylate reductase